MQRSAEMGCFEFVFGILGLLAFVRASANTQLIFANRRDVRLINVPTFNKTASSSSDVVDGLLDAAAVDFLYAERIVFWTDVSLEAIKRTLYVNGSVGEVQDIITTGLVAPDGLACDWVSRKLYWSDSHTSRIEVSEIDGRSRTVLFWKDLHLPRAIALDPSNGYIYWTDWGEVPKIERAGMDGQARVAIVTDDIYWPNGLTIDFSGMRLYWVDAKFNFIKSSDMNGLDQRYVLEDKVILKHPFAMTVHNDWLYWTDWQTQSIHSCNKSTGGQSWVVLEDLYSPMDIHAFTQDRQPLHFANPCREDNGGCSHLCLLSPIERGYTCACPTGVRLLENGSTCADGAQELLLLARRKDIRRISLDTPDYTDIKLPLNDIEHAIAIDYDPVDDFIYWTDDDLRAIRRAKLDGSESEYVISTNIVHPDGIAVDWIARNLYWTDTGTDMIEVSRLNGTSRKTLIVEYLDEPRAIVVDPVMGYMYWTDWGIVSKIERANLDGTNRTVLVNSSLSWPNGIAVDTEEQKIYWGDGLEDKIEVINVDGTNRRVLVNEEIHHIFGFTLLGDFIYWTDWQQRTIEKVNKHTGEDRAIIIESLSELMGLKAISMERRTGTNPCGINNGGCSHLCLYRPQGHVCSCPKSTELWADGQTCIVPEAYLLFLKPKDIRRISLETTFKDVGIPLSGIVQATALDFDILDNRIYWADATLERVSRAFMNGSHREDIIEFGLQNPEGLAVDWLAHNIYFAVTGKKRIEVARLDGSARRVLIWKDIVMPRSLALDPMEGFMYWCEWHGDAYIERAYMDGTHREIIYRGGRASGLTIDYEDRRLYWASDDTNAVESTNMIGGDHRRVVSEQPHPFGLTQFRDFVYWSDWSSKTIERCNKTSGANRTRIHGDVSYVMDIMVFHASRQSGWNPCAVENGGCEHLCLSHPNETSDEWDYTCGCSSHYTLNEDNKTCSPPESFLLFSQRNSINRVTFDFKDSPEIVLPIHGVRNVRRIAYDYDEKQVYWIDSRSKEIKRAYDNGVAPMTFIRNPGRASPFEPMDMAIDPYSRLLFWTCANQSVINVTRLDMSAVGVVVNDKLQKPRLLALMPERGLMFWTNHRSAPKIERAALDGAYHMVIVNKGVGRPRTLTADYRSERIFWINQELRKTILSTTITGTDLVKLEVEILGPIKLTVMGDFLYWVDRNAQVIKQVDKLTGLREYRVKGQISELSDVLAVDGNLILEHPCLIDNGGCSHLCLVSEGNHARCSCPLSLVLDQDDATCVEPPTCSPDQFTCVQGTIACIPIDWRCDGLAECDDESDETDCVGCLESEFKCPGNQCIDMSLRCNGHHDCIHGNSDEEQCPECTLHRGYRCDSGQCLEKVNALCDGVIDCDDASDEPEEKCYVVPSITSPSIHTSGKRQTALVVTLVAAFSVIILIIGVFLLCRRWGIGQARGQDDYRAGSEQNNFSTILMVNQLGKDNFPHKYLSNPGRHHPKATNLHSCSSKLSPKSGSGGSSSGGLFERNLPTGASSCSSGVISSTGTSSYPKETLNPPPSPVTERSLYTAESFYAAIPNASISNSRSYKHHKLRYIPPPPTPCSTDVCEDSEPYSLPGGAAAMPHHKYTNISKSRRKKYWHSNLSNPEAVNYDSEPYPPPPTPHSQYLSDNYDSCPPSPSTERSFFNPYPPPPSPATDST